MRIAHFVIALNALTSLYLLTSLFSRSVPPVPSLLEVAGPRHAAALRKGITLSVRWPRWFGIEDSGFDVKQERQGTVEEVFQSFLGGYAGPDADALAPAQ